jgi:hypothetical protein
MNLAKNTDHLALDKERPETRVTNTTYRILTGKIFENARLEVQEVNGRESREREIFNGRTEPW